MTNSDRLCETEKFLHEKIPLTRSMEVRVESDDERQLTLSEVLARHPGDNEVRLRLVKGQAARVFEVPRPVTISADLFGELKGLLGPNCLV